MSGVIIGIPLYAVLKVLVSHIFLLLNEDIIVTMVKMLEIIVLNKKKKLQINIYRIPLNRDFMNIFILR